ncbi:MAG: hypothetical protein V1752_00005, partial [Candidatus Firestonebacteria bacterium]
MQKVFFLAFLAALTFCFAEGKPPVSDQELKMMEEMGVFDEIEKGEAQEQPGGLQGKPGAWRQGIDSKESLEAVILARVKSELDLTPEQAGKFVENFYKAEEVKKEY